MNQHKYIKSVELKGYKSIKDLKCAFMPGLNIIIGDNGSGKSNFFEFVNKCSNQRYQGLADFYANIELVNYKEDLQEELFNLVWRTETRVPHGVDIKSIEDLKRPEYKIEEPPNMSSLSFSYIKFLIPEIIPVLQKEYNPTYKIGKSTWNDEYADDLLPGFLNFLIDYLYPARELKHLKEFTDEAVFKSLNSFFEGVAWKFKKNVVRYSPVEDIRLSNSFRIARLSTDSLEFKNIVLEYKVNGEWFSWNGLSDGTKRIIYIIGEVIGQNLDWLLGYKKVDVNFLNIVLLEEPELGVHPHQLHQLLQFLKEEAETHQIFITTHSPQVLDILSVEELNRIIISEITPENGTIFRHLTGEETEKAQIYLKNESLLSDYWRFSDFQRTNV